MSTTYLDLCIKAYEDTSMHGTLRTTRSPGLAGSLSREVSSAWVSIQEDNSKDFTFMKDVQQFTVSPGRFEYTAEEVFGIDVDKYGEFLEVLYNGRPLKQMDVVDLKLEILNRPSENLSICSVDSLTDSILIYACTKAEDVSIIYNRATQCLLDDDDVVNMNKKHQDAITWLAVLNFASDIGNPNLRIKADGMFRSAYTSMCRRYNKAKRMTSSWKIV